MYLYDVWYFQTSFKVLVLIESIASVALFYLFVDPMVDILFPNAWFMKLQLYQIEY